jgi:hypothetical protein
MAAHSSKKSFLVPTDDDDHERTWLGGRPTYRPRFGLLKFGGGH